MVSGILEEDGGDSEERERENWIIDCRSDLLKRQYFRRERKDSCSCWGFKYLFLSFSIKSPGISVFSWAMILSTFLLPASLKAVNCLVMSIS